VHDPNKSNSSFAVGLVVSVVRFIVRLPAHALLLLIRVYQRFVSPALPAIFGSTCGCRFAPTCSHYAAEAIRVHGTIAGVIFAAIRLVKCTPLHPGGFDPVPARRGRPRCTRLVARATATHFIRN
jgi:putative membrane protein insertion efficiency factor